MHAAQPGSHAVGGWETMEMWENRGRETSPPVSLPNVPPIPCPLSYPAMEGVEKDPGLSHPKSPLPRGGACYNTEWGRGEELGGLAGAIIQGAMDGRGQQGQHPWAQGLHGTDIFTLAVLGLRHTALGVGTGPPAS